MLSVTTCRILLVENSIHHLEVLGPLPNRTFLLLVTYFQLGIGLLIKIRNGLLVFRNVGFGGVLILMQ